MELGITLIVVACLMINATRVLVPHLYTDGSFLAAPVRLMLGLAILVCAMNVLLRYFPGTSAAWISVAVLLAIGLGRWASSGVTSGNRKAVACAVIFALGLLGWRLLEQLKAGALIPIEGAGHDELWYIFSAEWLRTHSLADPFLQVSGYPLTSVPAANLGSLPRIGSESLLVLFSGISGTPIDQVYPALAALGAVLFGFAASQGFLQEADGDWKFLPLALLAVAASPVALFIYGNENFATMWGLVFLAGYYWNVQRLLSGLPSRSGIAVAGIFLGALLATYPELLAIAGPASMVLFIQAIIRDRKSWPASVGTLASCGVVAAVAAPFAVFTAFKVLATGAAAAQGQNIFYPDLFTTLSPANLVVTLLAFDTGTVSRHLGMVGPAVASIVLVLALLFAPRRVWSATAGMALGSLFVLCIFWRSNYGYGGMKAIEFMALPAATLIGAAAGRVALVARSRGSHAGRGVTRPGAVLTFGHASCALLALVLLGVISVERTQAFSQHGAAARLSTELRGVAGARAVLPANAVLQVGPELYPHPFVFSRWVAYLLPDVQLVYPTELQGGGYIYGLEQEYEQRKTTVTHVLRARSATSGPSASAIWRNAGFEIVPADEAPFMLGRGFHSDEGWGRWMSERAEVELRDSCARELRIHVSHRYEGVKGEDALILSAGSAVARYRLQGGAGEISFQVPEGVLRVELRSAAGGMAPSSLGGGDGRVLSYAIKNVSLTPCARQPDRAAR